MGVRLGFFPFSASIKWPAGSTLTRRTFRGEPLHGARRQNQIDLRWLQSSEEIDVVESFAGAGFQKRLCFRIAVQSLVEFATGGL